jgi:RNA polymerase sigma-70 factor (sigma-E family)
VDAVAEGAFREFVAARASALLRTAYLLTGDRGLAEDAVQVALTRLCLAWPRIRHSEAIEAYVRRILVREVLSWRRRRRVSEVLVSAPPELATGDSTSTLETRDELLRALQALPPRQRAVLVLRYFDDAQETQIAELLGISTGSVKTHASRGLAALRQLLEQPTNAGLE